jgi:hypothetical protein
MHGSNVQSLASNGVHAWRHKVPLRIYFGIIYVESLVSQASCERQHSFLTRDRLGLGALDARVLGIDVERSNRPISGSSTASACNQTEYEQ